MSDGLLNEHDTPTTTDTTQSTTDDTVTEQSGEEVQPMPEVVQAMEDFTCSFQSHTLSLRKDQVIDNTELARFLWDTGAPVDLPVKKRARK